MATDPNWDRLLGGIDFSPLAGEKEPPLEKIQENTDDPSVFVQKIVTEIWVYTDIEGKMFGKVGMQDIVLVGQMSKSEALKTIEDQKTKRRKKSG